MNYESAQTHRLPTGTPETQPRTLGNSGVCLEANKIYNSATDYARQVWLKEHRYIKRGEFCQQMKWNRHCSAIYVSAAQQICNGVAESFASFKTLRNLLLFAVTPEQLLSAMVSTTSD